MTNDMTRGNSTRLIISFTLPVLFGNLCQQLYGMVDSIIVGRAISMEALAAVGATGGISFLVIGCIQGLTAGFSVITAQRFGAGDYEGVKRSVATSALLSLAATVLLTAAGILTARPLLEVMNTPADIIEDSYAYIIVIYYGVAATAFYNLLSCIIRALGDSKTPLIFLVFASFLNVALDLLFIIIFHMGVGGAAWATVLSQGVSGLLCLGYAWRRFPLLRMEKRHWTFDWSYAWKHLRLALPMAMQFVITGISVLVNQAVLNLFGSAAVAAFSAASKIHMLSEQVAASFGTAMATYAGQNYGAGKVGRVREGLRKCALACEGFTLGIMVIITAFGGVNCTLFVRQYDILNNKWGDFMTKGIGNKRYTPEFKKIVVETMREEGLSYKETRLRFEIAGEDRVRNWERIYLEEGPEGLAVERRGRKITGRPRKLPQSTEEDLIAENQRLRAEVAYLKNLQALVLERERRQQKKRW